MSLPRADVNAILGPLCFAGFPSCRTLPDPAAKFYHVHRISEASIHVDGVLDESDWDSAAREAGCGFPWLARRSPTTEFRALADDDQFFFAFRADDADVVIDAGEDEEAVARGDRVELFFARDVALKSYVCFEVDPSGRIVDYKAEYHRKFDFDWDLREMVVAAALTETGYVVEGSIPHAAFRALGLPTLAEDEIRAGIFRAEFSRRVDGETKEEWISWVRPRSQEPDFHIPSAFGWLR